MSGPTNRNPGMIQLMPLEEEGREADRGGGAEGAGQAVQEEEQTAEAGTFFGLAPAASHAGQGDDSVVAVRRRAGGVGCA